MREGLLPGQAILFSWTILPAQVVTSQGTLWIYSLHQDGNGNPQKDLLVASPIAVRAFLLAGLPWKFVRLAAWGAVLAGGIPAGGDADQ